MPDWLKALGKAGMLCLPLAHRVCQGKLTPASQSTSAKSPQTQAVRSSWAGFSKPPDSTDEARGAELEGMVLLRGTLDEESLARTIEVAEPLGLGSKSTDESRAFSSSEFFRCRLGQRSHSDSRSLAI